MKIFLYIIFILSCQYAYSFTTHVSRDYFSRRSLFRDVSSIASRTSPRIRLKSASTTKIFAQISNAEVPSSSNTTSVSNNAKIVSSTTSSQQVSKQETQPSDPKQGFASRMINAFKLLRLKLLLVLKIQELDSLKEKAKRMKNKKTIFSNINWKNVFRVKNLIRVSFFGLGLFLFETFVSYRKSLIKEVSYAQFLKVSSYVSRCSCPLTIG
jgi:hypothetical protein